MKTADRVKTLIKSSPGISAPKVAKQLKISRQMAARHLSALVQAGKIHKTGSTRSAIYFWGPPKAANILEVGLIKSLKNLREDQVFDEVKSKLSLRSHLNKEGQRIAYYSFSEMLNNAIDHSESKNAQVTVAVKAGNFLFTIKDAGIGIFNRVKKGFKLKTDYDAIEHLFKGKQTTFPERHSGQGIFFTSRIADKFAIRSNDLTVVIDNLKKDQIIKASKRINGTEVSFQIKAKTKKKIEELFREYANEDFEFDRNSIRVKLSSYKELISRSQARQLLIGLDKFDRIVFDFKKVNGIGQAYADEVFRVFANMHPKIKLTYMNASEPVEFMIRRALKNIL
jgi:anti-sigma regulatory factor (Ser/Thr protein kinase)